MSCPPFNLAEAKMKLDMERALMAECIRTQKNPRYDPRTSCNPCVNRGWDECDCPPGGPYGCSPYDSSLSEEENRIALENVAEIKEKMIEERLEELRFALKEEIRSSLGEAEAQIEGYDYLHILEQEFQNLLCKSRGQTPFPLRRPSSATPMWRKEYAGGGGGGGGR